MQITTLLLAATALLASTLHANPIQSRATTIKPNLVRQETTVHYLRVCEHIGYKGECASIEAPEGQCVNIPDTLSQKVSSMRIPKGTHCLFLDKEDCPGHECADKKHCAAFDHDRAWLKSCGGWLVGKAWAGCRSGWNDRFQSVKCYTKN
ncbi:hypothetical protein FKW77_001000 [Venturia effusa]|uniref:Uncharacterized protein n=1 Tax=Venturia effusa TaxID=50376 RepID=A0A517LAC8_9PEZI|nr:hypothetical protein FKW77_001000 [Venturia effusa]